MRRRRYVILVLSLLLTFLYVQGFDVPTVEASTVYQGNLVLLEDNVTIIEGSFDINGSIKIYDNATLILQNAVLNLTQSEGFQFLFWLQENASLLVYNSTITASNHYFRFLNLDNSTITIENSIIGPKAMIRNTDNANLSISDNSCYEIAAWESSFLYASNLTVENLFVLSDGVTEIYDSEIESLTTYSKSVTCSISNFHQGLIDYWNFISNCSVSIQSGGYAPNLTLVNTDIYYWRPVFFSGSNVTISNSTIRNIEIKEFSRCYLYDTFCYYLMVTNSTCWITDARAHNWFFGEIPLYGNSTCWLLNSKSTPDFIGEGDIVYVSWYLDVLVEDSIDQAVPSASVTVSYPNSTVVDSKLTDANGLARFELMEKMVNATGEYPIGNYTVEATYETYLGSTTVNMTETQDTILTLENLVIPEFSSLVLTSALIIATIVVIIANRKKQEP